MVLLQDFSFASAPARNTANSAKLQTTAPTNLESDLDASQQDDGSVSEKTTPCNAVLREQIATKGGKPIFRPRIRVCRNIRPRIRFGVSACHVTCPSRPSSVFPRKGQKPKLCLWRAKSLQYSYAVASYVPILIKPFNARYVVQEN